MADLSDYVEVSERLAEFFTRFPEGRLQPRGPWRLEQAGERLFIVYEAAAYRSPDDPRPGIGTAWEPFPGPTAFTRDSELQNAETSAWGRAMIATGIASKRIATREDVQARTGENLPAPAAKQAARPARGKGGASDSQRRRIHALRTEKAVTRLELGHLLEGLGVLRGDWKTQDEPWKGWMDRLTPGRDGTASKLIDELEKFGPPIPDRESDVPTDPKDFADAPGV